MTARTLPDQAYKRLAENRVNIRKVPCPHCGVKPGFCCKNPSGGYQYTPHQARRHLAAETGVYTP
jgi:hypothetical protein